MGPVNNADAIYKKCNYCGLVYVKPTGCDFETYCGKQSGEPLDIAPWTYEFDGVSKFDIIQQTKKGKFEDFAYYLRRQFVAMVNRNRTLFYGSGTSGGYVKEHNLQR